MIVGSSIDSAVTDQLVGETTHRGASMARWTSSPSSTIRARSWRWVWACPSPPMVPNTSQGRPSRRAMAGMRVCSVRLRGATALACDGSSENIAPRFWRLMPQPGTVTPDPNPM